MPQTTPTNPPPLPPGLYKSNLDKMRECQGASKILVTHCKFIKMGSRGKTGLIERLEWLMRKLVAPGEIFFVNYSGADNTFRKRKGNGKKG